MTDRPRGYTAYQTDEDWRIRHDESGAIFTGFGTQNAAYLAVDMIEEDLDIDGDERCGCGCGEIVKPGSRFRQGHDARLKGQLIRDARAGIPIAIAKLRAYGWLKFLDADTLDRNGIRHEEVYES